MKQKMEKKRTAATIVMVLGLWLGLLVPQAWSHDLWLNMTDHTPALWQHAKYAPEPRAKTVVYIGWGHAYPVADFISDRVWGGMQRIEPDGTRVDMTTGTEGFRAVRVDLQTPGPRVFAAWVHPAFYGPVEGKKESGNAELLLENFYGPWIVKASKSISATGEMAEKCESLSYTATMTFALPFVKGN
jgi:hypothetical protein